MPGWLGALRPSKLLASGFWGEMTGSEVFLCFFLYSLKTIHLLYPEDGCQPGTEALGGQRAISCSPPRLPEPPYPLQSRLPWGSFHNPPKKLAHPREGEREGVSLRRREGPRPKWATCVLSGPGLWVPLYPSRAAGARASPAVAWARVGMGRTRGSRNSGGLQTCS